MLAKSKYQNVEQLTFDIKPSKWMLMINDCNLNRLLKSRLLIQLTINITNIELDFKIKIGLCNIVLNGCFKALYIELSHQYLGA